MSLAGGWSEQRELDYLTAMVFERAMLSVVGYIYTPKTVSTQIVSGTNYCFYCDRVSPFIHDPSFNTDAQARVFVYQDLNGIVTMDRIELEY